MSTCANPAPKLPPYKKMEQVAGTLAANAPA
jgi:hypothetical protein